MAFTEKHATLLDEACTAARERRRLSKSQGPVSIAANAIDEEFIVVVTLEGPARADLKDWQTACMMRSHDGSVNRESPARGPKELTFKPKKK